MLTTLEWITLLTLYLNKERYVIYEIIYQRRLITDARGRKPKDAVSLDVCLVFDILIYKKFLTFRVHNVKPLFCANFHYKAHHE